MDYSIEIRPLATLEILEAYDWYEEQSEGLGFRFLNELEFFYESLFRNPNTYGYFKKPVREGKINHFPYTVVYEVFDKKIVVYSVFMSSQNPLKKRTM